MTGVRLPSVSHAAFAATGNCAFLVQVLCRFSKMQGSRQGASGSEQKFRPGRAGVTLGATSFLETAICQRTSKPARKWHLWDDLAGTAVP